MHRTCCEAVALRHCAGSGREAELYADLTALGVAFWTEEDLRDRGFFKTPDARLRVRSGAASGLFLSARAALRSLLGPP